MFATIAVDRSLVNRVVAHAVAIVLVVVLCQRLARSETKRNVAIDRDATRVRSVCPIMFFMFLSLQSDDACPGRHTRTVIT